MVEIKIKFHGVVEKILNEIKLDNFLEFLNINISKQYNG